MLPESHPRRPVSTRSALVLEIAAIERPEVIGDLSTVLVAGTFEAYHDHGGGRIEVGQAHAEHPVAAPAAPVADALAGSE